MISAPEPADERQRLQALQTYQMLDTPPEECFDDLTFLAAELFGAPIALVTLVDAHRQWFKSHHGLHVTETPREFAFCAHAISSHASFVVEDAHVDPRFFDSPLVTGDPHVRFYAGSPLISPEGHALGTLCVIDHLPRSATPRQLELLRRLGRQVIALFELKRLRDAAATAAQDAQRRANESESFLQRVEHVSGVGGFMMDLKLGELRLTHQSYRIHDLEQRTPGADDLVDAYVPRNIRERLLDVAIQSQASGRTYDIEAPITTEAGRKIWVRTAGEVEYEDGTPVRVVGAIQDVTERRTMEHRLREVIAVAERANKAKSEFLANMSHEIRTPLNAVIGLGYLLEQTSLSDDQQQFLKKIQFAGRALLSVVNNVLDLSKIEAGEMALENEAFDLRELIRDVSQMLSPQAEQKGVKLLMRINADLPRMTIGDTTRLRQVVINLVNNAIKFTDVGQVTLQVSCAEQSAERLRLRCVVTDTGIGIDPRAIERLFTPFNQADTSTTRRFGGTGLGLSITRRLIELMGGEIGVTSTVGVGSSFWIEVPLRIARGNDGTAVVRGMRILIADSRGDAPEGLAPMIRSLGWTPVVADSEAELLGLLGKTPADTYPNVLMVELNWHGASAHELISRLESRPSIAQLPPIIVVAERIADYQDHAPLMRSTDSLLVRPLTSSALFNAVSAAVARVADLPQPLLQSTIFDEKHAEWLAGVRVLVVDDSEINLEVARRILEKQGATVALCTDGQGAVDHVRAHSTSLDIVLMDVQMPVLDGNEATKIIREQLQLATLPIVALTAGALVGERQRSLDAGMTEFISKPFDPLGLIRKVRRLVEAYRGTPIPMTVLGAAAAGDAGTDARRPLVPSVDATVVQQMFGEDLSLFESLLTRLLRDYADLALPADPTSGDETTQEELKRRVHKLKGSAGMIGAKGVARLAGAAEAALQQSRPADGILQKLAAALITLREEAQPLLDRQSKCHAEEPARTPDTTLEAAELKELHALLHSQNLAAIDKFSALAPSLREALGGERFSQLSAAVDNLEFARGADLLRATLPVALAS